MTDRPQTIVDWLVGHDRIRVVPLVDEVIDALGHDPRSAYAETYWLAILGPSSLLAARALVRGLDTSPAGFELPLGPFATQLGLGAGTRRTSPLLRTLDRLAAFGLAAVIGDEYAIRRAFPPLARRQLVRLPPHLVELHRAETEASDQACRRWRSPSELAGITASGR